MTTVTVFRCVPPPIIGVCGVVPDRGFEAFEATLDWLETTGVLVERFDPQGSPAEVAAFDAALQALARAGERCLPLLLVNGVIVSAGRRLARTELARLVGLSRQQDGEKATPCEMVVP